MENIDIEKVKESIDILKPGNTLYEIRILQGSGKRKNTISGYFRGTQNLEKAFRTIDLRKANVFLSLNDIDSDCYAREQHEKFLQIDDTTSDTDIVSYQWLLIDLDPKRRSRISSTEEELKIAKQTADRVKAWLTDQYDFPNPIVACSGNGMHLLYRINLPNTKESESLIKRCLSVLDTNFSDEHVDIDKSVFNPSRVSKLYGTIARKGADTPERPHRMSKIISVPKQINTVPKTLLEFLADEAPAPDPPRIQKSKGEFNIEDWLSKNMIRVSKTTHTADGATKYILEECPFDNSHKAPDSMIIVQPSGAIGFRCLHNSCADRSWPELRLMYEPDAYDDKNAERDARINEGWKIHKQYMITRQTDNVEEVKKALPKLTLISANDLQQKEFGEIYYAVEGMIPEGETVIAAPPKTGKSWLMLDMCLSVAKGDSFLGFDTRMSDTLYLALEDGDKFEQERLNKVTDDAPDNFHFVFENVMHLNEGFLLQLDEVFQNFPNIKLVVIDTLNYIQYHPGKGESAYNCDYRTGKDLKAYAENRGIAIVVVTHTTKMIHAEDEMMNVSGTNGVTGAADSVIVLSKERRTDLDAKMFVTGRKVRQSMHDIKFNDQTCRWEYKGVSEIGDKDQREQEEKERKYFGSKIRDVVIMIAKETDSFWKGRAGDLIDEAVKYKIGLKESNKAIGGFLNQMQGLFMEHDRIQIEKIKNGTGPYIYRIYKQLPEDEIYDGFFPIED